MTSYSKFVRTSLQEFSVKTFQNTKRFKSSLNSLIPFNNVSAPPHQPEISWSTRSVIILLKAKTKQRTWSLWMISHQYTICELEKDSWNKKLGIPRDTCHVFSQVIIPLQSAASIYCYQWRLGQAAKTGLVEVGRLCQQLNVLTQGRRVAQTGDERPFSLTAPGSDPQPGIKPGLHWGEADTLPIGHVWFCHSPSDLRRLPLCASPNLGIPGAHMQRLCSQSQSNACCTSLS